MSLFPAYSAPAQSNDNEDQHPSSTATTTSAAADAGWLENNSFILKQEELAKFQAQSKATREFDLPSSSLEDSSTNDSSSCAKSEEECTKKKQKKKTRKRQLSTETIPAIPPIEFTGDEEYYVDKLPALLYKTIRTLHKPACPRYRTRYYPRLIRNYGPTRTIAKKRYYQKGNVAETKPTTAAGAMEESEYTERLGQLNRKTMGSPGELEHWLDLIQLQDRNPYRWSRLRLAEKKLDLVQRALVYHQRCEALYRIYIDTIIATYPAFEVSKMLDRLLAKDPYNYTIWTARIMTTQGTMARCIVPDVLSIYERCMQKMHHAQKQVNAATETGSDMVMLKLFNNCALFLRQSGLYEQFFALVKLALQLNVSTDQFGEFAPLESDQRTLIEFEELVLESGLPMNEIWLRIEKLRQGFNFLPCPINVKCSDPQRIVFNEDVCHYIYPLKSRDNSFSLMLLILRLLKVPFVHCDCLAEKFSARVEHIGDSDAIEDVLGACLRRTYALPLQKQDEFLGSIFELAKEMAVSPTFLANTIGHEIYTRCITEMLMNCASTFAGIDERKRIVFLLLLCRFERLLLVLEKLDNKISADYIKAGRSRYKALIKQTSNRDVILLYAEFALYEFEALGYGECVQGVQNTFENLIAAKWEGEVLPSDLCHTVACYAEILVGRGLRLEAMQVIAAYGLSVDIKSKGTISSAKNLTALQSISERLDNVIAIETNVEIMLLEQYLLPDYTVSLLKLRVLMQCLIGQKLDATAYMDRLLNTFRRDSDRHCFLREQIYELYTTVLHLPMKECFVSTGFVSNKIFVAFEEFPRNLFLLQRSGMDVSLPWYKVRAVLLRTNPSILSVIFLIALARYRFVRLRSMPTVASTATATTTAAVVECDQKYNEVIVRNRILSMFLSLTAQASTERQQQHYSALQRNGLFWRCYLRCLSDQSTAFETSKKCLLTALDECPWNKALYLDGATYVPQELSHLQDLMIEKQLRMYALPEELEILREK